MTDLSDAEIFRELDPRELQALREIAQERSFSAGTRIFSENDRGDGVYVIRLGTVEIVHLVGERALCIFSKFGPGEVFGEMSVIDDLPRSATTTAATDVETYFIPRAEMTALLRRSPALSFKLLQEISRRLRDFNQRHLREILQAERLATIGTFARSIVHDLKTPLTVIGMATEIMSAPNSSLEIRRDSYQRVRRQITAITDMVGDILDYTQSVRVPTAFQPLNFREFVQTLTAEMRSDTMFRNISLRLENEPPDVRARFDPRRLRRVFLNLIGNAVDMMPDGGEIIARFKMAGGEVTTEIQDTGPGIAPEVEDKLFQVFVTHGKAHGTGLGLSICKKTLEDCGGRISARNAPGRGAIFSFTLPVAEG